MKIFGCVLLVVGTTAFGIYKGGLYVSRLNNLYEIKRVFLHIQSAIRCLGLPMPEALEEAGARSRIPCRNFFLAVSKELEGRRGESFQKVWQEWMEKEIPEHALEPEARAELWEMGDQLGCLDQETQIKNIDYFLEKWDYLIERRNREKSSRVKLYYMCGVMSGLLIMVLLV